MEDGFGDFSTDVQEGSANARDAPAASAQEQACKFLMMSSEQREARASTPTVLSFYIGVKFLIKSHFVAL